MSWIRQNSFLAAFFAFTGICAIALGALLYFQYDKYSTVAEEFTKQAAELKRLQTLAPFPNEENLQKLRAQKQGLDEGIAKMQAQLVKMALPAEAVTPEQFQDRLRSSVLATVEMAKQNGVKLPDNFYLGFDGYQTLPPKKEATLGLSKQLAGIELVFKTLIESKIVQVDSVKRSLLSEEDQKGAVKQPARPAASSAASANGPVQKIPFEIAFKAEQNQLRKVLNSVVQADNQFFILRTLRVMNEKPKAPSKREAEEPKVAPAAPEGGKPADAAPSLKFVLGTERIDVIAQVEIVSFKIAAGK